MDTIDEQEPKVSKPRDLGELEEGEPDQVDIEEFVITVTIKKRS